MSKMNLILAAMETEFLRQPVRPLIIWLDWPFCSLQTTGNPTVIAGLASIVTAGMAHRVGLTREAVRI